MYTHNVVNTCHIHWWIRVIKVLKQLKWHSRSLKVIDIGAIRSDTCDFLLVFYCNYSLSCTASEILPLISPNFKRLRDPEWTPYWRTLTCVIAVGLLFTFRLQTKIEMSSFVRSKDMAWAQKCRQLVITRLILYVANSCTKFGVCSRCRDISGGVKF